MKRQIVLDTETTGLDPNSGHRIVEIGCVEIFNFVPTGRVYHQYINPERNMPFEAFNVHGLSIDFLGSYPTFAEIAHEFIHFIEDSELVIHNAPFDMKFIDHHLKEMDMTLIPRSRVIDTLSMARKMFPGAKANLDALCSRFDVNNTHREKHGALLDSEILAEVYLHLQGGRQPFIDFPAQLKTALANTQKKERPRRSFPLETATEHAHKEFLNTIKEPLWLK
jgi:DNA polymerase III subunit epsilon